MIPGNCPSTRGLSAWLLQAVLLGAFVLLAPLGCTRDTEDPGEAAHFNAFAREVFAKVYPTLADQILKDYGIREGICLDLGCGPAYLGIEIARRSELEVIGVDIDPDAVRIARDNVALENLDKQVTVEEGDVHSLRFADSSADLIISRGSFPFWKNPPVAFREIHRVLRPGGVAFIGGGMGRTITPEEKAVIRQRLAEAGYLKVCKSMMTPVVMQETLEAAGIRNYRIMSDGRGDSGCRCGMWVEIRKP
jgi:ubiquinone/menaquinone biosynthesis C-methylase UbiE